MNYTISINRQTLNVATMLIFNLRLFKKQILEDLRETSQGQYAEVRKRSINKLALNE